MIGSPAHEVLARTAGGLLGRDEELAGVAAALEISRLVTLTGTPGIGKTRLALAVASGHRDRSAVVELAPVADLGLVPAALASALSVEEAPGLSLIEAVVRSYRRRRLLLVLDNCEHLIGGCAQVVGPLLAGCPDVRVLATSREPLGVRGEHVWHVPPLAVPPEGELEPDALAAHSGVALLVERASEVQPGFALNAFLAADVAEICRRLEGIALAIELAAARVETLTPREIARRLQDRFDLLSDGGRSPLPRHRTLAAALEWSHALLRAPERAVLRRLSVFVGRFELQAAEAVCAGDGVDARKVAELLHRLVSKSLLAADAGPDGLLRYRLLETIRSYAADKLERAGEVAGLRTAHAQWYLSLAERAEPELTGPRQELWLERLDAERANLRAALEWSTGHGQAELALRLAGALVLFWRVRCHFSEGRDFLRGALAASDAAAPELRAWALWGDGFLTYMAGDPHVAIRVLEHSLACFRDLGDRQGRARALLILANAKQSLGDPAVAALLEESARIAREAGDSWCLAHALGIAGFECARQDELRRARELLAECLAVAREAEDMQGLRVGLLGLGQVAVRQGYYDEAQSLLDEAVQVTAALGEAFGQATALRYLGALALGQGDYARAGTLLDEGLALIPEIAPPEAAIESFVLLARVAHAQGGRRRARRLLEEAFARGHGTNLVQMLGQLALEDGDPGEGRRLFEEARKRAQSEDRKGAIANALYGLGELARGEGDEVRTAALHDEALELRRQVGELPGIADSLEAVAGLAAAAGHHRHAARLFGAASSLRDRSDYARAPWERTRYESDMGLARQSMPADEFASTYAEGEALPLEQAVSEASKGPRRTRPANGWHSLTKREQEVVDLAAEGLTNPEIAERLVISRQTVKRHLSNVFSKLGVTGRRELAREVRSRNGEPQ